MYLAIQQLTNPKTVYTSTIHGTQRGPVKTGPTGVVDTPLAYYVRIPATFKPYVMQ